jgi:ankyrin repeat protein
VKQALYFGVGFACVLGLMRAQTADDVFRAIRANDLDVLRRLSPQSVNVRDRLDTTPLHYAALYGNTESVRILLERGADPKARNKSEATPLIYAACSFDKTRLLVEKGADVNAQSAIGMTPLLVAVSVHGNMETVRYLLDKGADLKAVVALDGTDALQMAAEKGDVAMVRLLLKKGADPRRANLAGYTALLNSFAVPDKESVQVLIDAGSDVNVANTFAGMVKNGPIALVHLTPLELAVSEMEPSVTKALLKAGARPNEPDCRKLTPLAVAVATDGAKTATIRQLIDAHADVNAKDLNGESVLDWALKFRNPEVLQILQAAGAKPSVAPAPPQHPSGFVPGAPKDAVARSSALLAKSGEIFFAEGGGCVGCHHQPLNARAFAALRAANGKPDERIRRTFLDGMIANRPFMVSSYPQMVSRGGDFDESLAQTEALIALDEPASPTTDAIVHYLAGRQSTSGAWENAGLPRPPLQASSITRTAYAVRALKAYGWPARRQEFDERIARARGFLLTANPATSYEQADRIVGLKAAGASSDVIEKAARALMDQQRPDGGWSQTAYLDSDAYATGLVLSTLYQGGYLKPASPAYARGVAYLVKTQFPDGSWYVRSRAPKLQPYFQSAFPYDHDQWISTAATAMAVMALAPALQ